MKSLPTASFNICCVVGTLMGNGKEERYNVTLQNESEKGERGKEEREVKKRERWEEEIG